ncbi:MAG: Cell division inhibitor [Myxococcales bacterium]|nr:Cell division inhibitor [Myxococcales bacterium]
MDTKKVILAGGSGFLGRALARALMEQGYEPIVLTRKPSDPHDVLWDGRTLGPWVRELEGAHALVNLTGRSVDCRYTARNRQEILESRIRSVEVLGAAIGDLRRPPRSWIQAGSLAVFGDRGDDSADETAQPGKGFSVEVCRRWESAFAAQRLLPTRKVFLRMSFVLGREGGALPTLARFSRQFVGRIGSGRQFVSWVHVEDVNRIVLWAIERESVLGTYNATAPNAVRNEELMTALRVVQGRRLAFPLPNWAVRIGSLLLGTEPELILGGRRGVPSRLLAEGFRFQFPELSTALTDLLGGAAPEQRLQETRSAG